MKAGRFLGWMVLGMVLVTAVACGGRSGAEQPLTSALTQDQAAALAENAMQGFAAGDYDAWSRDWSAAMRGAVSEDAFLAYRQQVLDAIGAYQGVESVTIAPSNTAGYVRWVAVVTFEKGKMEFAFSFRQDGRQIEGVFPREIS